MSDMEEITLDKKDRRILHQLDIDCRQSYAKIGKKVGLSKEVVKYRVEKLERQSVISHYYTIIDVFKLGYLYYMVKFKYQNMTSEVESQIIEYLQSFDEIGRLSSQEGIFNIAAAFFVNDINVLQERIKNLNKKFGRYLREKEIATRLSVRYYSYQFLYDIVDHSKLEIKYVPEKVSVDEIDIKVLRLLSKDARKSLVSMSRDLDLSPKRIQYRIKKLERQEIIKNYTTHINLSHVGYSQFRVFLYLENQSFELERELFKYLEVHPNIIMLYQSLEEADIEFQIVFKSHLELHDFMTLLRDRFEGKIRDYRTELIWNMFKLDYFPA